MASQEALPENLVALCLDVLRKLSASERDLIRVVVEVVQELRDTGKDNEDIEVRTLSFPPTPYNFVALWFLPLIARACTR